jgi:hypothetical protein
MRKADYICPCDGTIFNGQGISQKKGVAHASAWSGFVADTCSATPDIISPFKISDK